MCNIEIKETKKSKKTSKTLKNIENVAFIIFMIIMGMLIFITAQSRFIGKEPSLLGHRIYIVNSGSMSPTIKQDTMIIVKESVPNEIVKGDIVTYYGHNEGSRVTHRVMEVKDDSKFFITKGDANESYDPLPLEGDKLIGKVVFTIPFAGSIFRVLGTKLGITLLAATIIIWAVLPKLLSKES